MPRKPRIHLSGGLYHVILRGNSRQDIFFADEDRFVFYRLLEEGVRRFNYRIHAFCLMSNHVHLAMQMGREPLSRGLQNIAFRYTRHINRAQDRVGHLFQGRYKALLVDEQSYGLELVRYIHLNPVRAKIVRDPALYAHSAHLGYLGKCAFGFLTTDWVLSQFDTRIGVARTRYARFVADGITEGHRPEFHSGSAESRVIGDERFVQSVIQGSEDDVRFRGMTLERIVEYVCKDFEISEHELALKSKQRKTSDARTLTGWLALSTGIATLSDVARRFKRDVSGLSRGVTRLEASAARDAKIRKALAKHRMSICQA